ncbi:MAG: alpha/beta hydrolase [candidate division Zixibacteria bacterium]|nr:alpha/beta hydrolase [candidate division Zixibacteria bacterium]
MSLRNYDAGWKAELVRMLSLFAVVLVLICVVVLAAIYFFQDSLLYFPTRQVRGTPGQIGLAFEDVTLETKDAVSIDGWYIPADSAKATILFCHGNAGNIGDRLESIAQFHRMGLAVFIFDYRGYGKSTGSPSEQGIYLDAEAAWDYLTGAKGIDPKTVVILGRSLGGAIATWLAAEHRPGALIVESSFTSLRDIAARHYPFLPIRLLLRYQYNNKETITRVTAPVMIAHSPDDNLVPYRQGEAIYAAANEPKEFLKLSGSHNDSFLQSAQLYENSLSSFIEKHIKR